MRPASFPDANRARLQAGMFASDLASKSEELLDVFSTSRASCDVRGVPSEVVRLPITIPFDENDVVLLGPATLDCAKKPATLELLKPRAPSLGYRLGIGFALRDGGPLHIPGVNRSGVDTDPPVPVHELTFAVTDDGFAVVGFGPDGEPLDLTLSENTACLLATALIITLGVKLAKAERGVEQ